QRRPLRRHRAHKAWLLAPYGRNPNRDGIPMHIQSDEEVIHFAWSASSDLAVRRARALCMWLGASRCATHDTGGRPLPLNPLSDAPPPRTPALDRSTPVRSVLRTRRPYAPLTVRVSGTLQRVRWSAVLSAVFGLQAHVKRLSLVTRTASQRKCARRMRISGPQ